MARHGLMLVSVRGLVALAGSFLVGCASSPSVGTTTMEHRAMLEDSTRVENGEVLVYAEGMGCPLCATNVEQTIGRLPGVSTVSVDLGEGRITMLVYGKERPTRGDIARAVYDAGFTVREIVQR